MLSSSISALIHSHKSIYRHMQPGYHSNPALSITSITTATRTTQFESTGSDSICASLRVGALLLCCITQLQLQTQVGHSSHLSPRLTNQSTDICNPDTTTTRIHTVRKHRWATRLIYIYIVQPGFYLKYI